MKKIFTLFATALISLSMFATAPVAKQLSHAATKHNAPAVKAETIDVTFDNSSEPSFEYYAADGDWYLGWIDVTSTYIIRLDYVVGFEGQFGSYTIADLDLDYSYLSDYSSGARVDLMYTDAQFTIVDEGDGAWSLSGYVVCENGNTYNLSGYYESVVLEAVASVDSFSTLEDLAGLTISFSNYELALNSEPQETDGVFLMDAEMNNVFAFATSYSFEDNVLTITGFEELEALPEEAAEMVIYMEGIFDGYYQVTVPVAFAPASKVPEHLYIIGDFQSWTPAQAVEMTAVEGQEGVFTYDYELATNGYFGFITVQDADWDVVNANRFGAAADGAIATVGAETPNAIVAGTGAFQIPAGHYTFTVDVVNMTFVAEDAATGIHNTTVENVTKKVENGHVVILRDGKKFNLVGAEL